MLDVKAGGQLTINKATLQNFYSNKSSVLSPISNEGHTVLNDGGTIRYNQVGTDNGSSLGGGILSKSNGTLDMKGGLITKNAAYGALGGGGIGLMGNSELHMQGGTISNNTAHHGGGILAFAASDLRITGGTISGNQALRNNVIDEEGYGGGLMLLAADAHISGSVNFSNNEASGLGGAIYVNNNDELYLEDVLIRNNTANWMGGGIWTCPAGSTKLYVTNGGAVFGNHANANSGRFGDTYGNYAAGDDFASLIPTEEYPDHCYSLSTVMLGGGNVAWYKDGGLKSIGGDGDVINACPDGTPRYDASNRTLVPGADLINADKSVVLKAIPDDGAKDLAENSATVKIIGNTGLCGGAIATNGSVIIGIKDDLTVGKLVSGNDANQEDEFVFQIDLTVPESSTLENQYGTVQIQADQKNPHHHGTGTFTLKHGQDAYLSQLPVGTEYTVTETDAKGYTTTWKGTVYQKNDDGSVNETPVTSGTGTEVSGTTRDVQMVTGADASVIIFTNSKNTEEPGGGGGTVTPNKGSLQISKKVTGRGGDANASFTFTVKLTDKNDAPVSGTYSGVTFGADGTAQVALKGGQSLTLTGIPMGTHYTVTEDKADQDGYTTTATNDTGTITTSTQRVTFTNDRGAGDLTVSKTVSGNLGDKNKAFTFTVALDDTSINGTYGDMTFIDGVAEFTLKHGESATATGLPEGVKYTVVESDNDGYTVTKTGDTGTIVENETQTAAFENHMDAGDLTVTKTVTGDGDKQKDFIFTVTLSDKSINGTYGDMTFVNGVATFTLRDGGHKTASGLPVGVTYTVTESGNEGYTVTKTGDTGTISADSACVAAFTNDMQKEEETPGTPENPSTPGNPATPQSPENPQNPSTPANPNAPKTGDESHIDLWIAVCGIAAVGVVIVLVTFIARRHRKHVTQNRYL